MSITVRHFDTHLHGRRRPMMDTILPEGAKRMCGGILEPNTNPHLYTYDDVAYYLDEVNTVAPNRWWAASIYLTPHTKLEKVSRAWEAGLIGHVKWYPPHGSTHSDESVRAEDLLDKNGSTGKLLQGMAEQGIPLKNHPEVTELNGREITDPYEREAVYFRAVQRELRELYPNLRQILAHLSTHEAVQYMLREHDADDPNILCEVTPHHLMFDRSVLYDGGYLLPDHHCLPVVKSEEHHEALQELVKRRPRFLVAGSDMAAHSTKTKYAFRAFGGYYTYHCSLELYVQALEELGALKFADDFLYGNAKRFHSKLVPDDPKPITLTKEAWAVEERVPYAEGEMTPFGYHDDPKKRFEFQWKIAA